MRDSGLNKRSRLRRALHYMTIKPSKKMHVPAAIFASMVVWVSGAAEGLLLARLLARLLAARPDSPAFAMLYALTWPLIAPLTWLDLQQRRFGATLELSTLATAMLVPALAYLLWAWLSATSRDRSAS